MYVIALAVHWNPGSQWLYIGDLVVFWRPGCMLEPWMYIGAMVQSILEPNVYILELWM